MKPNKNNFCGGNFKEWLEVMLLPECNARCSWCIEKCGFKPKIRVDYRILAEAAINSGKQNIILLGGEPTLYVNLKPLITLLKLAGRSIYLTTNGSKLSAFFAWQLKDLTGINISIHDYSNAANQKITGIALDNADLRESVRVLKEVGVKVRFNCNCIQGHIDSKQQIIKYVRWAASMGVDTVRFAELKLDTGAFVDLAKVFDYRYGLNGEPYSCGCSIDAEIEGMQVNFRQMCGMQTELRPMPCNPIQDVEKSVLYYDGKIYDGWQAIKKEEVVTDKELVKLLEDVAEGKKSPADAALIIGREIGKVQVVETVVSGGGCRY